MVGPAVLEAVDAVETDRAFLRRSQDRLLGEPVG
jgi:hypothetical protein